MKFKLKNYAVKLLALVLAVVVGFPVQIFATAATNNQENNYDGSQSVMGLSETAPAADPVTEAAGTLIKVEPTVTDKGSYILEKQASLSLITGELRYKISLYNKEPKALEEDQASNLTAAFAINNNTNQTGLELEKVTSLKADGSEAEVKFKKDAPNILNNNPNITTLAAMSTESEIATVYYLTSKVDAETLASINTTNSELPNFGLDMAILDESSNILLADRYALSIDAEKLQAGEINLLADDSLNHNYKGDFKAESSSIFGKNPAQITWTDYILSTSDDEFTYNFNLDDKQDTTNTKINIEFFTASTNGFTLKKEFSSELPFASSLNLAIPKGAIAKIELTTGVGDSSNVVAYTFNGKATKNPSYVKGEATTSEENLSEADEDPLPDNHNITDEDKQDFSSNPKTATQEEEVAKGENSTNSSDEANSSNDIIADETDQDLSAISLNKDSLLAKYKEEEKLSPELEEAINKIAATLEQYNKEEINWDQFLNKLAEISNGAKLEEETLAEILTSLIAGLKEEKYKVAAIDPAETAAEAVKASENKYTADGRKALEPMVAGPEAEVPEDDEKKIDVEEGAPLSNVDKLVKEKLQEEGLTMEEFQNFMYELEEKYGLTNEDAARIYTENEDAINALVEKLREDSLPTHVLATMSSSFSNKLFNLKTEMNVMAIPNWAIPAGWWFDVNIGPYLKPHPNYPLKNLVDPSNPNRVIATPTYDASRNTIRYNFPNRVSLSKNLPIDQILAFNTDNIPANAEQISVNISVKPKNNIRQSMPTITVKRNADSPVVTAFPNGKVPVQTPSQAEALKRTYPYDINYWTYQYYNPSTGKINWDIRVKTSEVKLNGLNFNNLGISLYAPVNQGLTGYKVTIKDNLSDVSNNSNAYKVREGVSSGYKTYESSGNFSQDGNLLKYDKTILKSDLPDDLIIHVEANPIDGAAKFAYYDLGLRVTPDTNYINDIVSEFKDDYAKLLAMMPWIIPYMDGEDFAKKFEDGFNIVDTRLPAYTYGIQDEKYETKVYADKSRSVFGQLVENDSKTKWQISETLRLQDKDRFLNGGSQLADDIYSREFNSNDNSGHTNPNIEVYEPNPDGSFTKIFSTSAPNNPSSASDFRIQLAKVQPVLKPGTVVNYIFNRDVTTNTQDSTIRIPFSMRKDDGVGIYGGEKQAYVRKQSTEEQNDRYHIGMEFRPVKTNDTWRYSQSKGDIAYRVYENYDMVFCINPGVPSPVSEKFWTNDDYQIHKEKVTVENLRKRLPHDVKTGEFYTRFTPEQIEENLKKTFYYAEQLRLEKNLDDFQYYQMVEYVVIYFTISKNGWIAISSPSTDEYIAPSENSSELLRRVNSAQGWNYEKSNSVILESYWNTKDTFTSDRIDPITGEPVISRVGTNDTFYAHSDQWQNMITGKVIKPIKFKKLNEAGNALSGAEFIIRDQSGDIVKEFTSNGGQQDLYLKPGRYTVEEVSSPLGYKTLDTFSFEIKEGIERIEKKDIPLLKEYKVGAVNDIGYNYKQPFPVKEAVRYLHGTTTVYRDKNRQFINSNKKFYGGNYVQEYYEVELNENTNNLDSNRNQLVSFNNDKLSISAKNIKDDKASFEINKKILGVDGTKYNFPGVKFTLTESGVLSNDVRETVTDSEGKISFDNLPYNTNWTLKEEVPQGVKQPAKTSWDVEIDGSGKVFIDNKPINSDSSFEIVNEPDIKEVVGKFKIRKVSSDDNNQKLPGATFELSGNGINPIEKTTEDPSGEVIFDNLKPGSYTLTETKSPKGYSFADKNEWSIEVSDIDGSVTIDGEDITDTNPLIVKNKPDTPDTPTGKFKVLKTDKEGTALKGVGFKLYGVDDTGKEVQITNGADSNGQYFTGDKGELFFWDLPDGVYYLEESQPLKGYVFENGNKYTTIFINNGSTSFKKGKVKLDTSSIKIAENPVGVSVTHANGTAVTGAVTGDGTVDAARLPDGDYTISDKAGNEVKITVREGKIEAIADADSATSPSDPNPGDDNTIVEPTPEPSPDPDPQPNTRNPQEITSSISMNAGLRLNGNSSSTIKPNNDESLTITNNMSLPAEIVNGDTLTVKYSTNLRPLSASSEIRDGNGNVIATARFNNDNSITYTFNEKAKGSGTASTSNNFRINANEVRSSSYVNVTQTKAGSYILNNRIYVDYSKPSTSTSKSVTVTNPTVSGTINNTSGNKMADVTSSLRQLNDTEFELTTTVTGNSYDNPTTSGSGVDVIFMVENVNNKQSGDHIATFNAQFPAIRNTIAKNFPGSTGRIAVVKFGGFKGNTNYVSMPAVVNGWRNADNYQNAPNSTFTVPLDYSYFSSIRYDDGAEVVDGLISQSLSTNKVIVVTVASGDSRTMSNTQFSTADAKFAYVQNTYYNKTDASNVYVKYGYADNNTRYFSNHRDANNWDNFSAVKNYIANLPKPTTTNNPTSYIPTGNVRVNTTSNFSSISGSAASVGKLYAGQSKSFTTRVRLNNTADGNYNVLGNISIDGNSVNLSGPTVNVKTTTTNSTVDNGPDARLLGLEINNEGTLASNNANESVLKILANKLVTTSFAAEDNKFANVNFSNTKPDDIDFSDDITIKIINIKPTYPATGGSGDWLGFAFIGTALMVLAAVYFGLFQIKGDRRRSSHIYASHR